MTKQFEYLPHTADIKFRAYGKTLEAAFINSAYALASIVTDYKKIKPKIKKRIRIESEDKKALLYDFLEQLIILLDSNNFLLHQIISLSIKESKAGFALSADIAGDAEIKRYKIDRAVKAITYEEMEIKVKRGLVVIQAVVDI